VIVLGDPALVRVVGEEQDVWRAVGHLAVARRVRQLVMVARSATAGLTDARSRSNTSAARAAAPARPNRVEVSVTDDRPARGLALDHIGLAPALEQANEPIFDAGGPQSPPPGMVNRPESRICSEPRCPGRRSVPVRPIPIMTFMKNGFDTNDVLNYVTIPIISCPSRLESAVSRREAGRRTG
jgi:hypothetical protein